METEINRGFGVRLGMPAIDVLRKAALILGDKIDDRCGAPEGSSLPAGVMIVGGNCIEHGKVQVDMGVHAPGQDVLPFSINDLRIGMAEILPNHRNFFAFNQNIRLVGIAGGDQGAVFN